MVLGERKNTRRAGPLTRDVVRFFAHFLFLGALIVTAAPAHAIDNKKTAMALAQQAAKAFEAGDMDRAAQAYLEAWHTDSSEPNYLYGAARAEQSAGQRDRADEHYRQFVAMEAADPVRVAKAKGYLTEFDGLRSDEKAQAADRAARREDWRVAAAAYGEAWQVRQDRLPLLLKAARAANESGDRPLAESWLQQYLHRAPADAADRAEAQAMLDALDHKGGGVPAPDAGLKRPTSQTPLRREEVAQVAQPGPRMSTRRVAGWWTLGSGAAIAATGAVLIILGKGAERQLNQDLNYDGQIVHGNVTYDDATSRATQIGVLQTAGVSLLSVGVATIGIGAALVWMSPDAKVSIAPSSQGLSLAGQF